MLAGFWSSLGFCFALMFLFVLFSWWVLCFRFRDDAVLGGFSPCFTGWVVLVWFSVGFSWFGVCWFCGFRGACGFACCLCFRCLVVILSCLLILWACYNTVKIWFGILLAVPWCFRLVWWVLFVLGTGFGFLFCGVVLVFAVYGG